jgi:radical SAM-linked protein
LQVSAVAKGEFRLRICYRKAGRLRFLSHLEVVHSLERAVRRSGLAFAVTQGFSPHLKAAFGPALPVGTAGDAEYLDVYLARYTPAEEALAKLAASSPQDLAPHAAAYVADREPALTAAIDVAEYRVGVDGEGVTSRSVQTACEEAVARGELSVEHKGKTKVFDLSRALWNEPRVTVGQDGSAIVEIAVRIGPEGSLRPDVFLSAALQAASLSAAVTSVTRTGVFISQEGGVLARPV